MYKYFLFIITIFFIGCSDSGIETRVVEIEFTSETITAVSSADAITCSATLTISEVYGEVLNFHFGRLTVKDSNKEVLQETEYSPSELQTKWGVTFISPGTENTITEDISLEVADYNFPLSIEWIVMTLNTNNDYVDFVGVLSCQE